MDKDKSTNKDKDRDKEKDEEKDKDWDNKENDSGGDRDKGKDNGSGDIDRVVSMYDLGSSAEGFDPLDARELEGIVEGILFAAGDAVQLEKIASIIGLTVNDTRAFLSNMELNYRNSKRGLLLRETDGKYQLSTKPEHSEYIFKLVIGRPKQYLSQAAYEALSIIAYNSNVTRAAIEKIRGVNSDSSIDKLLERGLIKEAGRLNVPGRPMAYDVTDEFYRHFGVTSKDSLSRTELAEPL